MAAWPTPYSTWKNGRKVEEPLPLPFQALPFRHFLWSALDSQLRFYQDFQEYVNDLAGMLGTSLPWAQDG